MKAFDNEDSVNAIPRELETIFTAFVNECKPPDKDKKAIKLVWMRTCYICLNYILQRELSP